MPKELTRRFLENPGARKDEHFAGCNRSLGTAEVRYVITKGEKEHVAHQQCLEEALAVLKQ